jgi:hypothetical protein
LPAADRYRVFLGDWPSAPASPERVNADPLACH